MSNSKMREDFRRMAKWAIRKMYEKNPGGLISVGELQKELRNAWDDLCEDGELIDGGDGEAQFYQGLWDLPAPGIEPLSHALAGRFLTQNTREAHKAL